MDADGIGVTLTDQNFQMMVLESPQPVLVAFWAEGCGPWHVLAPEVAALAEAFRGQAAVATLDVEAEPEAPKRYRIETLPALLFLKDGQVVDQLTGVVDKADIAAKLHALTEPARHDHSSHHATSVPRYLDRGIPKTSSYVQVFISMPL
jgi:thioredoxin